MPAGGAAFSAFLAEVLADTGFYPGLKPRPHAGSAAEFIALCDREPEDALEDAFGEPEDEELRQWLGLEVELSRRREAAEIEAEEAEEQTARRAPPRARRLEPSPAPAALPPAGAAAGTATDRKGGGDRPGARRPSRNPAPEGPVETAPEVKARLRRLQAARRDLEAFVPGNGVQRRLVGLVSSILGYMERNLCKPGQAEAFDRWWQLARAFRRALDFPELAGPRRRAAFERLMKLDAEGLFAAARRGRMSRRMPKKKRKARAWEEWRALV